jgi:TetR/AcrR family transcriptional regulator
MGARRPPKSSSASARAARPSTRNADRMRQEILAAAIDEFATKGVGGARIDAIAAQYGGSKNMIYHYFKSKDGLFAAVLEDIYTTIRERQHDIEVKMQDPVVGIRALVNFTIEVFDEHPEFVSLLNSENLAKAKHIKNSNKIIAMYDPLLSTIKDLLRRGAATGAFRKGVSAVDLYIFVTAMASYAISNRYTLSTILGIDIHAPARRKLRGRQITDMVIAYLTAKDLPDASSNVAGG